MAKHNIRNVRLAIGLLTGILLWLIWQAAAITAPHAGSEAYRRFLAELPPGWMDFFRPWTKEEFGTFFHMSSFSFGQWWTLGQPPTTDVAIVHTWIGFLPLACLLGVLFTVLKPMARFLLWMCSFAVVAAIYYYFHTTFHSALPGTPALIVLSCFYLCGTVIHLETEKIERNRNLAIDLLNQAENERKRIAKDLHDESLQSLSRVARALDKLSEEMPNSELSGQLREMLENCIKGTRDIIDDLHPAGLNEFGFSSCIEQFASDVCRSANIQLKFEDNLEGLRLPPFVELCIFRIAQESINNVEKHACATRLKIRLERSNATLILQVGDNGTGKVEMKKTSAGVHNIIHRTKLMGGNVQWRNGGEFSEGTTVILKVPFDEEAVPNEGNARHIALA